MKSDDKDRPESNTPGSSPNGRDVHDGQRRSLLKALLIGAVAATPLARAAWAGDAKTGASGAKDAPAPAGEPSTAPKTGTARSTVFRGRRDKILSGEDRPDAALLAAALGAVVAGAGGESSPEAAFKRLFKPTDVVGIKVNCIAGKGMSPRPEVVGLIAKWLQDAGVPARNVVIWDRTERELSHAGFELNRSGSGVRVIGTEGDYEEKERDWGPNASRFARLLAEEMTALINVGVLKDHGVAGVAAGMKNWYGAIENPRTCHGGRCAPYIPHLAAYPLIRNKLRLTVIDALTAQCHGGPQRSPKWQWSYGSVLASTDPVALDTVATRIIEDRRKEVGLEPLASENRAPVWLADAAKLGLGEADFSRIHVADV